jgi:hypothetical protein
MKGNLYISPYIFLHAVFTFDLLIWGMQTRDLNVATCALYGVASSEIYSVDHNLAPA